jgi:hypothetical protein
LKKRTPRAPENLIDVAEIVEISENSSKSSDNEAILDDEQIDLEF